MKKPTLFLTCLAIAGLLFLLLQSGCDMVDDCEGNHSQTIAAPDFTAERTTVYPGDYVNFSIVEYKGVSDIIWTFQGGNPNTSTSPYATVVYGAVGDYSVKLYVETDCGANSTTKNGYIHVIPYQSNGSEPRIPDTVEVRVIL